MTLITRELVTALEKGNAHVPFEMAVKDIPFKLAGETPGGLPYSLWQIIEHIRIAQWDILEFSRNPHHKSPEWPDGYWPREKAPGSEKDIQRSVQQVLADRKDFIQLLREAGDGVHEPFPHGDGQTLFREILLLIDHNSYHTGEIIVLRRLLGDWS